MTTNTFTSQEAFVKIKIAAIAKKMKQADSIEIDGVSYPIEWKKKDNIQYRVGDEVKMLSAIECYSKGMTNRKIRFLKVIEL